MRFLARRVMSSMAGVLTAIAAWMVMAIGWEGGAREELPLIDEGPLRLGLGGYARTITAIDQPRYETSFTDKDPQGSHAEVLRLKWTLQLGDAVGEAVGEEVAGAEEEGNVGRGGVEVCGFLEAGDRSGVVAGCVMLHGVSEGLLGLIVDAAEANRLVVRRLDRGQPGELGR